MHRHDVPAVSARSLGDKENLFFAEYGFSSQSLLNIDVKYKETILVILNIKVNLCDLLNHGIFYREQIRNHLDFNLFE